jgi:hypothetical protein
MTLLSESNAAQEETPVTNIPSGLAQDNPDSIKALNDSRKSLGFIGQSALMGAAAGGQAAQGQNNPLSAFIQGAAVGLQVPGQIYAQKRAQIQSAVDATPFAITHPDLGGKGGSYEELGGFPTVLAMKVLQQAAIDTHKVLKESESRMKEAKYVIDLKAGIDGEVDMMTQIEEANKIKSLPTISSFYSISPAYKDMMNARGPGGDKTIMIKFAQMLSPSIKVSESTMETMDTSSTIGKYTSDMWAKALRGEMTAEDRNNVRTEATSLYNRAREDYERTASPIRIQLAKKGYDLDIMLPDSDKVEEIKQIFDPKTQTYFYGKRAVGPNGEPGWLKVK